MKNYTIILGALLSLPVYTGCGSRLPEYDPVSGIREIGSDNLFFPQLYYSVDVHFQEDGSIRRDFIGKKSEIREWLSSTVSGKEVITKKDFSGGEYKQVFFVRRGGGTTGSEVDVFAIGTGGTPLLFRPGQSPARIFRDKISYLQFLPGYYNSGNDSLITFTVNKNSEVVLISVPLRQLKAGKTAEEVYNGREVLKKPDGTSLLASKVAVANRPEEGGNIGWLVAEEKNSNEHYLFRCDGVACTIRNDGKSFMKLPTKAMAMEDSGSGDQALVISFVDSHNDLYRMPLGTGGSFHPAYLIADKVQPAVSVRRNPFDQSIHTFFYVNDTLYDQRDANGCLLRLACRSENSPELKVHGSDEIEWAITADNLNSIENDEDMVIIDPEINGPGTDFFGNPLPVSLTEAYNNMHDGKIRFTAAAGQSGSAQTAQSRYSPQNDDDAKDGSEEAFKKNLTPRKPLLQKKISTYNRRFPVYQYLTEREGTGRQADRLLVDPVPLGFMLDRFYWREMADQISASPAGNEFQNRRTLRIPIGERVSERFRLEDIVNRQILRGLQDPDHPFQALRNAGIHVLSNLELSYVVQDKQTYLVITRASARRITVTSAQLSEAWQLQVGSQTMGAAMPLLPGGPAYRMTISDMLTYFSMTEALFQERLSPLFDWMTSGWTALSMGTRRDLYRIITLFTYYQWQIAARNNVGQFVYENRTRDFLILETNRDNQFLLQFRPTYLSNFRMAVSGGIIENIRIFPPSWMQPAPPAVSSVLPFRPAGWRQRGGSPSDQASEFVDEASGALVETSRTPSGGFRIEMSQNVSVAGSPRASSRKRGREYSESGDARESLILSGANPRFTEGQRVNEGDVAGLSLQAQPNGTLSAYDLSRGYSYFFRPQVAGGYVVTEVRPGHNIVCSSWRSSSSSSGSGADRQLLSIESPFPDSACASGDGNQNTVSDFSVDQTFRLSERGLPSYYHTPTGLSSEREFRFETGGDGRKLKRLAALQFFGRPSVVIRNDDVFLWYPVTENGKNWILGARTSLLTLQATKNDTRADSALLQLDWGAGTLPSFRGNQVSNLVEEGGRQWLTYCDSANELRLYQRYSFDTAWSFYATGNQPCDGPVSLSRFDRMLSIYAVQEGQIRHFRIVNDFRTDWGVVDIFSGDYLYARSDSRGNEVLTADTENCLYDCSRLTSFRNPMDAQTIVVGNSEFQFSLRPNGSLSLRRLSGHQPGESLIDIFLPVTGRISQFSVTALSASQPDQMTLFLVTSSVDPEKIRFFKAKLSRSGMDDEIPVFSEMNPYGDNGRSLSPGFPATVDAHGLNQLAVSSNEYRFGAGKNSRAQLLWTGPDGLSRSAYIDFIYPEGDSNPSDLTSDFVWTYEGVVVKADGDGNFSPVWNFGSSRLKFNPEAENSAFAFGRTDGPYASVWRQVFSGDLPLCTGDDNDLCSSADSSGNRTYNLVTPVMHFSAPDFQANFTGAFSRELHAFAPTSYGVILQHHMPISAEGSSSLPITGEAVIPEDTFTCFDSLIDVSHVDSSCLGGGFEPLLVSNSTALPNP